MSSTIEWTNATWSPVTGCTKVSAGSQVIETVKQKLRVSCVNQWHNATHYFTNSRNERKQHFTK